MSQPHLDEEQIQRALHGELRSSEDRIARPHLEACPECRARLVEAQREEAWIQERLVALDRARPRVTAGDIIARGRRRPWARMAAGVALALAGAAPGSPLPDLFARLLSPNAPAPESSAPVKQSPGTYEPAGIAILPGERLTIELSVAGLDTAVISLSDDEEVVVRASSGTTSFEATSARLLVRRSGSPGRVEILIPRLSPRVEVAAGSRRVLLKQGSRVTADVPSDSRGRYIVPLQPAP